MEGRHTHENSIPTGKLWSPERSNHLIRGGRPLHCVTRLQSSLRSSFTNRSTKSLCPRGCLCLPITGQCGSLWFSGWGGATRVRCRPKQTEQINPSPSTWPQAGGTRGTSGSSLPKQHEQQLRHSSGFPFTAPKETSPNQDSLW